MLENSQTLIRRSITLINDGEPVPDPLPDAVSQLGDAARRLHLAFGADRDPKKVRELALRAVRSAGRAYRAGVGFSGSVVVAQVRTAATDLLRATDLDHTAAVRLVRKAAGKKSA